MNIINIPIAKAGIICHVEIIQINPYPKCEDSGLSNVQSASTLHP